MPVKKFIDVESAIGNKNPALLRILPGFLVSYIKRIVHQDDINDFINRQGHKTSFDFVREILIEFGASVHCKGLEHLPSTGGCIVASNHPLGGLDAIALINTVGTKRRDVKFIVNDILLQIKNLENFFVGVNKHGRNTAESLTRIDELYASEAAMLIFPAGLVSRKQRHGISDLTWKKSFISKSKKHRRNIVPVYIKGRNTSFFYNFARFRTWLGIKSNVEMLYLADEMYKQRGQHIEITFGIPISYTVFDNRFSDHEWAQKVKEHVYILKDNPEAIFQYQ